jgi:hypothetical protein
MRLRQLQVAAPVGATLVVLCVLVGCAGVPESSAPRIVEAVPRTGVSEQADVRLQPRSPQPGQTPEEVVRAFVDAASSPERQHAVARQFLTPAAAERWRDDVSTTVLAKIPYFTPGESGSELTIRGEQVGIVDDTGAYTSYPPAGLSYSYQVTLAQVDGEWRITNPPPGVIMTASSFKQTYTRLNVYFLARAESRVIPDPRWLSASRDALPNLLLKALLDGPSPSLSDAVRTELGDGVTLASNVVPEADRVRVLLSGLADHGSAAQAPASAQIVWTLNQLGAPGVEIYDDGQLLTPDGVDAVQRLGDWRSYDPDSLPLSTPGYFVRQGAVWTTDGKPTSGPAGRDGYRAVSVGVSRDLGRLAVVGRMPHGVALYVGPARGQLTRRLTADSFTPPTWDPTGAAWTVRNGRDIIQVPARGMPVRVEAQDLDPVERIGKLSLSRDGSRVAILVGAVGAQVLYVGAVGSSGSSLSAVRQIVPGLANVVDVAWAAADSLVVLTRNGASDATLWLVAVDGSSAEPMTTSGLPGPPAAVAAAPGQPTLAVAENGVWRLRDPQEGWTVVPPRGGLAADAAPAYPD